uniref:Reverse transcriptase domain-containing protein n=1 Tax=Tanacetum cinerariifolium TaxID=118510 RepID=A0A6L2MYN6_TANCI|nr:reverse transcriptase domain-containing protein [Tanacetum cinerariifolium]
MRTLEERRVGNGYYKYHGQKGHTTNECIQLRQLIDKLVKEGRLDHLVKNIKEGKDKQKSGGKKDTPKDKATIYMVQSWQQKTRQKVGQKFSRRSEISFPTLTADNTVVEPLTIEINAGGHDIHHMYPSPYNGLIGRPRISAIRAVPSTAHGMLKFPIDGVIVTIYNTTIPPRECNTALINRGVAAVLAERDADRSRNGTEGVIGLTRWLEKMEYVFQISNCIVACQVKFASCTMQGSILTWWNSHMRAVGQDVAYAMPWATLKRMITDKYYPRELALMCDRMFPEESAKVERYIGGLPNMIHGSFKASKPLSMQEAIKFATEMMDKKMLTHAECQAEHKRKFNDTLRNTQHQQQPPKRNNVPVTRSTWVLFEEGDLVWIHLRCAWFPQGRFSKLHPCADGPFCILKKINDNTYKVELPGHYGVSDTFNVSDLSPYTPNADFDDDSGSSRFLEGEDDTDQEGSPLSPTQAGPLESG